MIKDLRVLEDLKEIRIGIHFRNFIKEILQAILILL